MNMGFLMSVVSYLVSLSLIVTPFFSVQAAVSQFSNFSTTQATSTVPITTYSPFLNTSTAYSTSNTSNSSSNSGTNSALGAGLLVGGVALGALLTKALTSTAITIPTVITSIPGAIGSFGGRIVTIIPCFTYGVRAEQVIITPAPATKNIAYIWTLTTLRGVSPPGLPPIYPPSPNPDPFPYIPGQEILGIADIPFFCCVPPSISTAPFTCQIPAHPFWIPVPALLGQRMQWANQSLLPGVSGQEAAQALVNGIAPL